MKAFQFLMISAALAATAATAPADDDREIRTETRIYEERLPAQPRTETYTYEETVPAQPRTETYTYEERRETGGPHTYRGPRDYEGDGSYDSRDRYDDRQYSNDRHYDDGNYWSREERTETTYAPVHVTHREIFPHGRCDVHRTYFSDGTYSDERYCRRPRLFPPHLFIRDHIQMGIDKLHGY